MSKGLAVCTSCHKTWETLRWLIRVNEAPHKDRLGCLGKVDQWKFRGRSERASGGGGWGFHALLQRRKNGYE